MTTGSIDSDYKSGKPPAVDYLSLTTEITARCPECGNTDCEHANALAARAAEQYRERQRLGDAVIEAAKRDRLAAQQGDGSNRDIDAAIDTRRALNETIDRLLEFESLQGKKG